MELTFLQSSLIAANMAWWAGFSRLRAGWPWLRCLGVALVAFPFARLSLRLLDLPFVLRPTANLAPIPTGLLVVSMLIVILFNLVVPGTGLGLALAPRNTLRQVGTFIGLPRRSLRTDFLDGQAIVGLTGLVLFIGFLAASVLRSRGLLEAPTAAFDRAGAWILLALTLVASATEEFLFRGILQNVLRRRLPELAAVGIQAAAFGLAHTGQGGLIVILGPAALGVAVGLLASRLGLLAAVLLHAESDLAYFALTDRDPLLLGLAGLLWATGVVALAYRRGQALRPLMTPLPRQGPNVP